MPPSEIVFRYHERTKHHPQRYARSLGYMDWETQPNPFRRYDGTPSWKLPLPSTDSTPPYDELFHLGSTTPGPVTMDSISEFFFYSLALSAWKQYGDSRWSLRVDPSSGNLHPTEGYIAMNPPREIGNRSGIYHYTPEDHALEMRGEFDAGAWDAFSKGLPEYSFLIGLTSIHWREAWKYGERAYRYCQHDAGHCIGALRLAASIQGWQINLIENVPDSTVETLFGLDRHDDFHPDEREEVGPLFLVVPSGAGTNSLSIQNLDFSGLTAGATWHGKSNQLSPQHVAWEVIPEVARACAKLADPPDGGFPLPFPHPAPLPQAGEGGRRPGEGPSAGQIIRQRRSAVNMDGETGITREQFYKMLVRVHPHMTPVPWDCGAWKARVHLGLFVHRVQGIPPGLYAMARDGGRVEFLKNNFRAGFQWVKPEGCPDNLPLFLLEEGDYRRDAAGVSCGQAIAGDGAFSFGMLAEFESTIRDLGGYGYRRLHWETGLIGQVMYLEAEAAGIRATGIGCFFDDAVHGVFGIETCAIQTLYHFTVGGPVDDPRLTTLPAYPQ